MIVSLVILLSPIVTQAFYYDVRHNDETYGAIEYLSHIGVVKGVNGAYNPQHNVTNRQVALMLVRALQQQQAKYKNPNFADVRTSDDGYKEIAIATELGIFPKEKYFYPNRPITREGMARALTRAFQLKPDSTHSFRDVPKNYWAHSYISTLAAHNITTGYGDGTFKPKQQLTRAHFAAFVARALVPEIRPSKQQIKFNQGMMPSADVTIQNFTYQYGKYTHENNIFHYFSEEDYGYNVVWFDDTIAYEEQEEYFISTIYDDVVMPYPLYQGKTWYDELLIGGVGKFKIITTNGIAVTPVQVYKDVVVVTFTSEEDAYTAKTFWFAKNRGLIRVIDDFGSGGYWEERPI